MSRWPCRLKSCFCASIGQSEYCAQCDGEVRTVVEEFGVTGVACQSTPDSLLIGGDRATSVEATQPKVPPERARKGCRGVISDVKENGKQRSGLRVAAVTNLRAGDRSPQCDGRRRDGENPVPLAPSSEEAGTTAVEQVSVRGTGQSARQLNIKDAVVSDGRVKTRDDRENCGCRRDDEAVRMIGSEPGPTDSK